MVEVEIHEGSISGRFASQRRGHSSSVCSDLASNMRQENLLPVDISVDMSRRTNTSCRFDFLSNASFKGVSVALQAPVALKQDLQEVESPYVVSRDILTSEQ